MQPGKDEPSEQQIAALADDLSHYDDQRNVGACVGRLTFGIQINSRSVLETVETQHAPTLKHLGLSIDADVAMPDTVDSPRKSRLHMDPKQFLSFLQSRECITDPKSVELLQKAAEDLIRQLANRYKPDGGKLDAQELDQLSEIEAEFDRLGLDEAVNVLRPYLVHAKNGTFFEYRLQQMQGLLTESERDFGPRSWHHDPGPLVDHQSNLEKRWDKALLTLRIMGMNPCASEMQQALLDHLIRCAEYSLQDLQQMPDDLIDVPDWKEKCQTIIEAAYQELRILESAGG